jgi:cbb3-type cytochrome oxidase maturation protein
MSSLLFLIPLSILVLIGAVVVLFRSIDGGQFEDLETPALLPMTDSDPAPKERE